MRKGQNKFILSFSHFCNDDCRASCSCSEARAEAVSFLWVTGLRYTKSCRADGAGFL